MMTLFELLYLMPNNTVVAIGCENGAGWEYIHENDPEMIKKVLPDNYLDRKVKDVYHKVTDDATCIVIEGNSLLQKGHIKSNTFWLREEFEAKYCKRVEA